MGKNRETPLRFISSVKTQMPTKRRALHFRVEARLCEFPTKGTEGQMEGFQRIEEPAGPLRVKDGIREEGWMRR